MLLGASAAVCHLAYRHPDIGVALLVGTGFAALLHTLMRQPCPRPCHARAAEPAPGRMSAPRTARGHGRARAYTSLSGWK